jgi:hypothetical protein
MGWNGLGLQEVPKHHSACKSHCGSRTAMYVVSWVDMELILTMPGCTRDAGQYGTFSWTVIRFVENRGDVSCRHHKNYCVLFVRSFLIYMYVCMYIHVYVQSYNLLTFGD